MLGVVAVIGGTFMAGFLAGRHWERVRVVAGLVKPQSGQEPARERAGAIAQPTVPSLTFYQELTAPLASPPPRATKGDARPAKAEPAKTDTPRAEAPKPEVPKPEIAKAVAPKAEAPRVESPKPEPGGADPPPRAQASGSYTVQVAAYATRAQADVLAGRLFARGFAADVSEITTQTGVRYRVRVGTYPTKEAARDALGRLSADVHLGGFVTAR
jgi:cell division septation protein DedD